MSSLEQLLRALDAKHISGWYHPAMRLQAELHSLQGVNAELREQIKQKEYYKTFAFFSNCLIFFLKQIRIKQD